MLLLAYYFPQGTSQAYNDCAVEILALSTGTVPDVRDPYQGSPGKGGGADPEGHPGNGQPDNPPETP